MGEMMDAKFRVQCEAMVTPVERYGSFHRRHCERKATMVANGKAYCTIHDPYRQEKRQAVQMETYTAKNAAEKADRQLQERITHTWPGLLTACKLALKSELKPSTRRIIEKAISDAEVK